VGQEAQDQVVGAMGAIESAGATIKPAGPPDTLVGVAQYLLPGIRLLASGPPDASPALAMLCAHALECLLRAYLSRNDPTVDDEIRKDSQIHHNLIALWERAFKDGLPIPRTPPDWADRLSGLHNHPFYLRYSTRVHGIVTPPAEPMVTELSALVGTVRQAL
jgi:hypothetical protein